MSIVLNNNMESNFKLNPCTDIEQSKRLLELGIRKETADCGHFYGRDEHCEYSYWSTEILDGDWKSYWDVTDEDMPAWSMGRLIEIIPENCDDINYEFRSAALTLMSKQNGNLYDFLIGFISQCIKMGYFPKEYLNGTTED